MYNIDDYSRKLLKFYELPYTDKTARFLKSHTSKSLNKKGQPNPFSLFRDAREASSHWMHDLNFDQVDKVQKDCQEAMALWKYNLVNRTEFEGKLVHETISTFDVFPL